MLRLPGDHSAPGVGRVLERETECDAPIAGCVCFVCVSLPALPTRLSINLPLHPSEVTVALMFMGPGGGLPGFRIKSIPIILLFQVRIYDGGLAALSACQPT